MSRASIRTWFLAAIASSLLASSPLHAASWQWRGGLGLETSATPHAVVDLELRNGPWSIALQTDTLDLRYNESVEHGRWWVGGRLAAFAAELFISPWENGAPAPEQALRATYAGIDAGYIHHLPHAWYLGGRGSARVYEFGQVATTAIRVPKRTFRLTPEFVLGRWSETLKLELIAGMEWVDEERRGYAKGFARYQPEWALSPLVATYGGYSKDLPDLTKTRIGGLNPYVIPLSGGAWAEWWVERYIVGRAGLVWSHSNLKLMLLYDIGKLDNLPFYSGAQARAHYRYDSWAIEISIARGIDIPRQPDVSAWSSWVALSRSWTDL